MDSNGKAKVKGKGIAGSDSNKRKRHDDDDFGSGRKRNNPGVLQFFEDAADVRDDYFYDGLSDFENDFEEEFGREVKIKSEPGKVDDFPLLPKEEEPNEEEFDRMMEKRYKDGLFVKYPEEDFEGKRSIERNSVTLAKEPNIWKVKCAVGRERLSAFCLMQKFVDLKSLGTKLQIISAFAVEHIKGFIFIESEKQCDVIEACKGLCTLYSSRAAIVPKNEISHLLSIWSKHNEISEGSWARVKNGKYKGDLAQVVSVSEARRRATIKLIPRIDLQAMAQKFGGGVTAKKGIPTPKLISSSELEEFRPLIQHRRDRETGKFFDFFDGLMLKDGYLYKKVSIDSLTCSGVTPSEQELLKFRPSENFELDDPAWLSQLYGEQKKKQTVEVDKQGGKGEGSLGSTGKGEDTTRIAGKGEGSSGSGMKGEGSSKSSGKGEGSSKSGGKRERSSKSGGKGEGSSKSGGKGEGSAGSSMENKFDLYDLVCFGRKDFGLILGMEKDNGYKILKGSDGPDVVFVEMKEIKSGPIDTKFTAFDRNTKSVSVNDLVKVAEGPSEGRQGIVKQVYRGILFLYDENERENGGYFCCKSSMCEKIKHSFGPCTEKGDESGAFGFGDSPSSPQSPLSPKKPWQARESSSNFNRGDKDSMYSVGQSLRIRVGPLKGYLCRVLAIRFSNVTVKLDSQHKVLTVKCEHLSEVRGRSSAISTGEDTGSGSLKPFDLLGAEGSSGDWLDRTGASAGGDGWNAGGPSAERSSWPSFNSSGIPTQSNPANLFGSEESKDLNTTAWENKLMPNQNSAWGAAAADKEPVGNDQVSGWNSWGKATAEGGSGSGGSDGWGTTGDSLGSSKAAGHKETSGWNQQKSWGEVEDVGRDGGSIWGKTAESEGNDHGKGAQEESWGKAAGKCSNKDSAGGNTPNWNSSAPVAENPTGDGGNAGGSWAQQEAKTDEAGGWKKAKIGSGSETVDVGSMKNFRDDAAGWNKSGSTNEDQTESWSKPKVSSNNGGKSLEKQDGGSSWGKERSSSWSKQETGSCGERDESSFWSKQGDSCGKQYGGSSWSKHDGGASWSNQEGNQSKLDGGAWDKKDSSSCLSKQDGGSSWNEKDRNKQDGVSSMSKQGGGSWNKQDGDSSWSKQDGASSWGKQDANQSKQDGGSSWGKQDGYSMSKQGGSCNKQDGGSSWSKQDGASSWGKQEGGSLEGKEEDSLSKQDGGSWGKQGQGSTWSKQDNGSLWKKQDGDSKQDGGSSWSKQEGGSWNKQEGGSTWSKQNDDPKQNGGSSWSKQDGGSWNKQGGGSWSKQEGDSKQDGGSSWSKQDGGSRNKQGGGSIWSKQDDGSSWCKQDGNSKQDGGSWNKQGEQRNWDRARGSGGRRGGFRGGRNQFGRGRSFDRGQSHLSQPESGPANSLGSEYNVRKDWNEKPVVNSDQVGSWSSWSKANTKAGSGDGASDGWGKPAAVTGDPVVSLKDTGGWNKQGGGSCGQHGWNPGCDKKNEGSDWGKHDGGSGWGKQDGGSNWGKQEGSYNKQGGSSGDGQDGGSDLGKQDAPPSWRKENRGSSWGKLEAGTGSNASDGWANSAAVPGDSISSSRNAGAWNKKDGGSWAQQDGNSDCDKTNENSGWGKQDGTSSSGKQDSGPSWGKQKGFWNKQEGSLSGGQEGGCGWGKQGGVSWGQEGGNSGCDKKSDGFGWGKQDGGSGWGKQLAGSSCEKQEGCWNKEEGDSSGGRQKGGSGWGKQVGGSSWGKQDGSSNKEEGDSSQGRQEGGSGWGKQDKGSSWGKQDKGSSWGKQGVWNKEEGGSSGGRQDGGSGWGKQDGGSSWGKQEGSWNKEEGGSGWGKQDGGSSWGKQYGSWNEARIADGDQNDRPRSFNRGRGSGGRRGGFRGGRNQFGRGGRSFNQDQSSSWNNRGREDSDLGNQPTWDNGQAGSSSKPKTADGGREGGWKKGEASGDDAGSNWKKGLGTDNN